MIEPPQSGFTGVVWEAREPDRLARDLGTGPGPLPMAEAGVAWSRLAASFGAAVVEYEAILVSLRGAWQSVSSADVHDRLSSLRDWLGGAAQAAAANAAKAEQQAAANELARLTMPNMAEIELIVQAQQMLQSMGAALGSPIHAVAAVTDTNADAAKAAASRVMRIYEAATEPLATPWSQDHPPVLTSDAALIAERAGSPMSQLPSMPQISSAALPQGFDPAALSAAMPAPAPTAYVAPAYDDAPATQEVAQEVPVAATADAVGQVPATPLPGPIAAGAPAMPASQVEVEHRAGLTIEGADHIGVDSGIVSAPAVLGGSTSAPAAPTQTQTQSHGNPQPGAA
ncbi:hypothetical protein ABIA39_004398 [Nocardia sp. GAS34]|uniref:PPE domain-containing protein n=1 Tax=unclassified Nocardia TaxID=2637762 RepID=UPI003D227B54